VLKGYFHETTSNISKSDGPDKDENAKSHKTSAKNEALLEYLLKVGVAIPMLKSLVSGLLKERLSTPFFKSTVTSLGAKAGSSSVPAEVMGAVIIIWLWANHRITFGVSFGKSGRIDVDSQCKWLARAAIEKATDEVVAKEMEQIVLNSASSTQYISDSKPSSISVKIAYSVSKAMNTGIRLNTEVNAVLPNLDSLVDHLEILRMKALSARCQERVLLASLVSKRSKMTEAFSNAYTSSMVRAGEALGFDDVGEIVQNELTKSSSQMPFDILSDASGAWEDPCRPVGGYTPGLDGDELLKKAHARAVIHKSLKKLQDRHNIKGGTPNAGPYSDPGNDQIYGRSGASPHRPSPRGSAGLKRKVSFSGSEYMKGMSWAAASNLFNPTHYSTPFIWDSDDIENTPYGCHDKKTYGRMRSPSSAGFIRSTSTSSKRTKLSKDGKNEQNTIIQSTRAIEWSSVAELFQPVTAMEKPSSNSRNKDHDDHNVAVPLGSTIFAPYCRKVESPLILSNEETDSEEENLDDEHILAAHQKVLNTIKDKFDTMMRIRQEYQDRSRRTSR